MYGMHTGMRMDMAKRRKISQNYMDTVLIPNPVQKWSVREDGIVVIDMENKGFYHKIAQKFFHRPKVSHIALDTYGTAVWKALDGNHSVFDVVNLMKEQFPKEESRMLDRVVTFLHTLQVNGFIMIKK
jgi:hypothetical protein